MAILDSSDYPAVRAAIDTTLDATNLPDNVISLPVFQGAAERWVRHRDANAETYVDGSDAAEAIRQAAIFACAALIITSNPNLTSETYTDGYRYTRKEYDAEARKADLWAQAEQAVDDAGGTGSDVDKPVRGPRSFFVAAHGYRGR